jgi:acyl carrier protein
LCESIASRLRIKDVDPEHPLGSYGLNSMEALRLLDRLERWLGEQLPATLFYEYPNIRELSRALAEGTVTESADYVAPDADAYG